MNFMIKLHIRLYTQMKLKYSKIKPLIGKKGILNNTTDMLYKHNLITLMLNQISNCSVIFNATFETNSLNVIVHF